MPIHKEQWLTNSLQVLLKEGVDGLTISGLTKFIGVTKGSFYHHFTDIDDFKTHMLAMCLEESTTKVIATLDQSGGTAFQRLLQLETIAIEQPALEVAIRAWALRDPMARAMLTDIDAQRMAYLRTLFAELGLDTETAHAAAQLYYGTLVGGLHLIPPLTSAEIQRNFAAVRQFYNIHE